MRLKSEAVEYCVTGSLVKLSACHPYALLCLLACLCLPAGSFAQAPQASEKSDANTSSSAQPAASPDSATAPEPAPSGLPTVTFQNGELTIVAFNATLHDVLDMVRSQTGATIDIPPEANERVFVRLGPGPVRSVLDSLLAGSQFNFIILGSATDPNGLSKVILSVKTNTAPEKEIPTKAVQAFPNRMEAVRTEAASARQQEPVQAFQQAEESAQAKDANPAAKPEDAAKQDNGAKPDAAAAKQDNGATPDTPDKTDTAAQSADASAADYPHTPNIKSAQEILQDLYDRRRQAMERQQQQQQQQPPPQQ